MKLKATINPDYFNTGDGVQFSRYSKDYIDYIAAGNTVDPADPIPLLTINAPVLADIQASELATLRALREFILGDNTALARIKAADDAIKIKRGNLKS